MKKKMYVGLSLSFCIKDIIEKKMVPEQIICIYAGTKIQDEQELNHLIFQYQETYWKEYKEEARTIARALWMTGKVIQPRLFGHPAPNISNGKVWKEMYLEF